MLILRQRHIDSFQKMKISHFKYEMQQHCHDFSPHLCKTLQLSDLQQFIDLAINRAGRYGFTNRGPLQLYIDMMLLFGSYFDIDPQYPWFQQCLTCESMTDQMDKANRLYQYAVNYLENVAGKNNKYTKAALANIAEFQQQDLLISTTQFEHDVLLKIQSMHPTKYAHTGAETMRNFVVQLKQRTINTLGIPCIRGQVLSVILGMCFGHSYYNDPLYPWIAKAINDVPSDEPEKRLQKLEKKTTLWLNAVLKNTGGTLHDNGS